MDWGTGKILSPPWKFASFEADRLRFLAFVIAFCASLDPFTLLLEFISDIKPEKFILHLDFDITMVK